MNANIISAVFENPLILKVILSHIPTVDDLKQARLVNRLWLKESLQKWRSTATLRLLWRTDPWYFCKAGYSIPKQNVILTRTDFLQLWKTSSEQGPDCPYHLTRVPFTRYRILNCSIRQVGSAEICNLLSFLREFGPHMKYLHLDHSAIPPEFYQDILQWILCERAISLEELTICLIPTYSHYHLNGVGLLGLQLSALPVSRVRKINLRLCKDYSRADEDSDGFQGRMVNREKSLSGTFPSGINFPHLTKLYLYRERVIDLMALRTLKGLKILWIESYLCTNDWNQRIARVAEETRDDDEEMGWMKLEQLYLNYYRFNGNTLRILWKWMPNLGRINLVLTPSSRRVVNELWPGVEVTDLTVAW